MIHQTKWESADLVQHLLRSYTLIVRGLQPAETDNAVRIHDRIPVTLRC